MKQIDLIKMMIQNVGLDPSIGIVAMMRSKGNKPPLPRTVFHYTSIRIDNCNGNKQRRVMSEDSTKLLSILKEGQLAVTPLDRLNDPLEIHHRFTELASVTWNRLRESLGDEECFRNEEAVFERFSTGCPDVASFCGSPINKLLWAHYANKSAGIALEFDTEKLASISEHVAFKRVDYDLVPNQLDSREEFIQASCYRKTKDWSIEDEYRLLVAKSGSLMLEKKDGTFLSVIKLPEDSLVSITFGLRCEKEAADEVMKCLVSKKEKMPKLYKLQHTASGLSRREIKETSTGYSFVGD